MSDENARRIVCQVEGENLVVNLGNETVLYLSRDEAYRLWYQVGEVVIGTFVLDGDENIIGCRTDAETVEVAGTILSVQEGRQLLDTLDPCMEALDELHSADWESDCNENVTEDVKTEKVNWMKEGF